MSGAIYISILNINKSDRCKTEEVYDVGFVPDYLVPKQRPCAIDAFLGPLVKDIEDSFIEGEPIAASHVNCSNSCAIAGYA